MISQVMRLALLITSLLAATLAMVDHQQADCKFHDRTYKFGEKWAENCATCSCQAAATVVCGPDVSTFVIHLVLNPDLKLKFKQLPLHLDITSTLARTFLARYYYLMNLYNLLYTLFYFNLLALLSNIESTAIYILGNFALINCLK